jgi:hypothetical protein
MLSVLSSHRSLQLVTPLSGCVVTNKQTPQQMLLLAYYAWQALTSRSINSTPLLAQLACVHLQHLLSSGQQPLALQAGLHSCIQPRGQLAAVTQQLLILCYAGGVPAGSMVASRDVQQNSGQIEGHSTTRQS